MTHPSVHASVFAEGDFRIGHVFNTALAVPLRQSRT
jgi:hypothetical protein